MRAVRGWLWFALAFTLVVAAGSVKAETIGATAKAPNTYDIATTIKYVIYGTTGLYDTKAATCAAHRAQAGWPQAECVDSTTGGDYGQGTCSYKWNNSYCQTTSINVNRSCPTGYTQIDANICRNNVTVYTCPSTGGWTLSGTQCTRPDCVAPQTRNATTGVCEIICPAAGSNAMIGGAQAWGVSGSSATCTSGISFSGCKITCSSGVSASGKASCTGCTFTGALATPSDAAADPTTGEEIKAPTKPEECLAKGMGYVTTSSGTTCVAQDQAPEPISTKTTETTTTKNGAGTTTGTEETTVECIGDKCTTTTTTKDGAGVTTGTTTSTGTGDKSGTDPEADKQSECDKNPQTIGCSEYGTPVEDGPLTTNAVGTSSLSPVLSSSGSCPADINLPKGMKFSWEYPCMYANGIRPVVIALAWLSAGFLLFGMRLD